MKQFSLQNGNLYCRVQLSPFHFHLLVALKMNCVLMSFDAWMMLSDIQLTINRQRTVIVDYNSYCSNIMSKNPFLIINHTKKL